MRKPTATTLAAAVLLLALTAPAQAHTRTQLDEWVAEWSQQADYALSLPLLVSWLDMATRHPWYFSPQVGAATAPASHGGNTGMGSNVEQWRPLVATYFAAELVPTAMCIMAAESGGNPEARNPRSTAAGLFQFLKGTWDSMVPASVTGGSYSSGQVFNPEANVRAAAWLQAAAGWSQWSPWNRGACRGL